MLPDEMEQYLCEIRRVLSKGKSCLITLFMFDESDASEREALDSQEFSFPIINNGYRLMNSKTVSANVAIEQSKWQQIVLNCRLRQIEHSKGYWLEGRAKTSKNSFQDIVILEK